MDQDLRYISVGHLDNDCLSCVERRNEGRGPQLPRTSNVVNCTQAPGVEHAATLEQLDQEARSKG